MSGLDRAFIRAYTKQHQAGHPMGASHARLAVGPRSRQVATHLNSPDQRGADTQQPPASVLHSPAVEVPTAPSYFYVDEPQASLAGPHWEQASPTRRPSSGAKMQAAPSPLMVTLSADWAGPAFEVDQFGWESPIAELVAYGGIELDSLGQKILSATRGGAQVVAIGSAEPGAGGTTLLLCLAQRLSAIQLRAALVDADFGAPSLATRLGMSPTFGWEDIATHERSLCDVLIHSVEDGITLLPLRGPVQMPRRLADDLYWRTTIDALRGRYRLVLLDVGVVGPEPMDLPWLRPGCGIDAAIVVGREGETGHEGLASAVRRLQGSDIDVLGVVENFCLSESERLARRRPRGAAVSVPA